MEGYVKGFLCGDVTVEDGKLVHRETPLYKREIKNRRVDEKGNKNALKATMLWFVGQGAMTHEDYGTFLKIKALRDSMFIIWLRSYGKGYRKIKLKCFRRFVIYTQNLIDGSLRACANYEGEQRYVAPRKLIVAPRCLPQSARG